MTDKELTTQPKQEVTNKEATRAGRAFVPNVDIYETSESLWLRADMPGVDEQSIDINVADGVLTIEGQVVVKDYENLTPVYTEYNVGNFARRFTLSNAIDAEKISARMKHGVLELELPKAETAKPRRITIATS
ncbi:MAG: Hsp20/alpha crystallin family protein [Candidatus Binatia bacterium]